MKRTTRLLTLSLLIQMFISGEPAEAQKAARQKEIKETEISKAAVRN